jgi:hypothetical protein
LSLPKEKREKEKVSQVKQKTVMADSLLLRVWTNSSLGIVMFTLIYILTWFVGIVVLISRSLTFFFPGSSRPRCRTLPSVWLQAA